MSLDHVFSLFALSISFLAFFLSIYTVRSERRQKRIDNLISLHQFLHQAEYSRARKSIREGECQILLKDPAVHKVCSSFDFAGTLVRNGAVDVNLFFQYWAIPLETLEAPLSSLGDENTGPNVSVKEYYRDFWWLFSEAKKYTAKRV